MAKARPYCPVCGAAVEKADAVEIWRNHEFAARRSEAAEAVADSLWSATGALQDVLDRRHGRAEDDEDRPLTSWEEDRLRECLAVLRRAQEAFKRAREKARI